MPDDDEDLFDTNGPPQDIDDLDDEMRGLLGQLDEDDSAYVIEQMVSEVSGVDGDSSPPISMVENPEATQPAPSIAPPEPPTTREVRRLDAAPATTETSQVVQQIVEPLVDLRQQFKQFDEVALEVLQGSRHDRQETQDGINLCRSEIAKAIAAGANPSRMWVDNLSKLLEVKTTANLTAIKALEAKAKLLAATKAGIQVNNSLTQQNLTMNAADDSLVDLLNQNELDSNGEDEF